MEKILIIEDDIGISNSLKLYLQNSDFDADIYNSGEGAIEKIRSFSPDLVTLDINLPIKNGIEICKELREFSQIPVIMLTARGSEEDKITGIEIGADDYIAKPFSPRELLARIKAILRRYNNSSIIEEKDIITFKGVTINFTKKIVIINGKEVPLTKNEYELFEKIVKENGKLVTRETLMIDVIGYDKYIYDRTLDTHIKNIRKKIGTDKIILTIRGEGYRLNN